MKILIVGAGLGGLSLAAFLSKSGIEYDIIDKARDWKHQGYSISIWNNGRNMLKKLGLSDAFDKACFPVHRYRIFGSKGKILRDYDLRTFYSNYGMALSLIGRTELHEWLIVAAGNPSVRMNTTVTRIEDIDSGAHVTFSDGTMGTYDLVVGADGIHSVVRQLRFVDDFKMSSGWNVWYVWVDKKFGKEKTVIEHVAPHEFVSLFDSGERTLAIIASDRPVRGQGVDAVRESFACNAALIGSMLQGVGNGDIVSGRLEHVNMDTWHKGRVVLMGDAAHGFESFGGIGGSMAMEDGYVLAGELIRAMSSASGSTSGTVSLPGLEHALLAYQLKRTRRLANTRKATSRLKGWALIRSPFWRSVIDFFMPYLPDGIFRRPYQALLDEEI